MLTHGATDISLLRSYDDTTLNFRNFAPRPLAPEEQYVGSPGRKPWENEYKPYSSSVRSDM
jgi:hypothetical protein